MTGDIIIPVLLQLAGIVVIIIEVFIPSAGILSVIAIGLFGYSIYFVFNKISFSMGMGFVVFDIILVPVVVMFSLKLLAKSPATLRKSLSSKDGVTSQSTDFEKYKNMDGSAVTDLRPSGTAIIDGKRMDVVTRGEYIEKLSEIVVYDVTGNQIIVSKKN